MKIFNRTLVFDFGSTNTVVCEDEQVVFDERTAIAVMSNGHVFAGDRAFAYFSDINYQLIKPIEGGVVVDEEAFEKFVKAVVRKLMWFPRLRLKTVVIAIPNEMIQEGNDRVPSLFECTHEAFDQRRQTFAEVLDLLAGVL